MLVPITKDVARFHSPAIINNDAFIKVESKEDPLTSNSTYHKMLDFQRLEYPMKFTKAEDCESFINLAFEGVPEKGVAKHITLDAGRKFLLIGGKWFFIGSEVNIYLVPEGEPLAAHLMGKDETSFVIMDDDAVEPAPEKVEEEEEVETQDSLAAEMQQAESGLDEIANYSDSGVTDASNAVSVTEVKLNGTATAAETAESVAKNPFRLRNRSAKKIERQPGERVYLCDACPERFTQKEDWKDHIASHNDGRNEDDDDYEAPVLGSALKRPSRLMGESKKIKLAEQYQCSECPRQFIEYREYLDHVIQHSKQNINRYECDVCGKHHKRFCDLKLHRNSHATEKFFTCNGCELIFKDKSEHSAHVTMHKEQGFGCDLCTKSYASPKGLKRHKRGNHKDEPRQFSCKRCGKRFLSLNFLAKHEKGHVEKKNFMGFPCHKCDLKFRNTDSLIAHVKTHDEFSDESKPFKCQQCDRCFSFDFNLEAHMKFHGVGLDGEPDVESYEY